MSISLRTTLYFLFNNTNTVVFDSRTQYLVRFFTSNISPNKHSFTVSYLINSCGFSLETATSVSKKVHFETPERPDSVLNLLRNHGFSNTHISKLVKSNPALLMFDAHNTLLPKLDFFYSIGVSRTDLVKVFSLSPSLLGRSLKNHLIPCYHFLRNEAGVDSKAVVTALKRSPRAFQEDVRYNLACNIAVLRELGVSQASISLCISKFTTTAFCKPSKFNEIVDEVKEMGFDPSKSMFVYAMYVISLLKKSIWNSRIELYGKWGWSKDVTLLAFRKCPFCMLTSNEKITKMMDFFVNKMGCSSKVIAKRPVVLLMSLEKRIIPRCSVAQVLLSKGLIKRDFRITTLLLPSEDCFLMKFVTKYQESVPQLLDLYKGKVNLQDLGINSNIL